MVLIVTLNPSIDLLYFEETFLPGKHNRFHNATIMAAGKGINCARALSYLGTSALAFNVIAGNSGTYLQQLLKKESFTSQFLHAPGETRHAITIMHDGNTHTEIVEEGPLIDASVKEKIFSNILQTIQEKNISILSLNGSVHTKDTDFYTDLIQLVRKTAPEVTILTDFSRASLQSILEHPHAQPDFVKPNLDEFNEVTGQTYTQKSQVINHLKQHPFPIPYTLISCGEQGAVAQFNGQLYDVTAPTIQLVNPTGSGDSTVAGAIYAFNKQLNDEDILRYAIASGTANAMESGVGVIRSETFQELFNAVTIKKVP